MAEKRDILYIFPEEMRSRWRMLATCQEELREIRLRAGRKILVYIGSGEKYLDHDGNLTDQSENAAEMEREELDALLSYVCDSSMYAFEDEIRRGYLTLPGGHRMGIVGEAVLNEEGNMRSMKHISGINLRIAHEVRGAADGIMPWLYRDGIFLNTLLVSPPCCGKTTMLRDIVRQVSDGNRFAPGMTVGVVDERSEIAGSWQGLAGNDVGMRTDVLDGCPKAEGMLLLVRSMAPRVIAVDELGGEDEIHALQYILQCGCGILATMHAGSIEEAADRLARERTSFERYVMLSRRKGERPDVAVMDAGFRLLFREAAC